MHYFNYNGEIFASGEKVISIENRGFRYGDGLFETIRINKGEILFFEDHMHRMFSGMRALLLKVPDHYSDFFFHKQILDLSHKNKIQDNARIRITIFRKEGGLYEPLHSDPEYCIEVTPLERGFEWSDDPCELGIFTAVPRDYSSISFFKTINALPYVMAGILKRETHLDECLIVNSSGRIADAVSSNVFWVQQGNIFTPPLSEGGIAGVMRKNLFGLFQRHQLTFQEKSITPPELRDADEVFLTNVVWGMKPVTQFEDKFFSLSKTKELFRLLLSEL